jgi:hypothetical protein
MGRKRKYEKSYVISMRISDEELRALNSIMEHNQIKRVSDLMRHAIELVKSSQPVCQHALVQEQLPAFQNYH